MKKFFYSFAILGMFGLFVLKQQRESASAPLVLPPTNLPAEQAGSQPSAPSSQQKPLAAGNQPPQQPAAKITTSPPVKQTGQYKDGQYNGPAADAYYGNIQVRATISGGKISDVTFLQYPNYNSTCQYINSQAMPYLRQEAIQAQSAKVQIISGATDSSMAFQESLAGALTKAKS